MTLTTLSAAAAGTIHRYAISQGGGSEGSALYLQSSDPGGAFQAQTGGTAYTGFTYPFGLFGYYAGTNGAGSGVIGVSNAYYGGAFAAQNSHPSILAYANGTGVGLEAISTLSSNTSPAIYAAPASGANANAIEAHISGSGTSAVRGFDDASNGGVNNGVFGSTTNGGFGVLGRSTGGALGAVGGEATGGDVGVTATSDTGYGLYASANGSGGVGIFAQATDNYGVLAQSNTGTAIYASAGSSDTSPALYAKGATGYGLDLTNAGTSAINFALHVNTTGTGWPVGVYSNNTYDFEVDTSGNAYVRGALHTSAGTYARTRNPGSDLMSYGSQSAEPTIEDVGSAQLVNGSAAVALGNDFRQMIDRSGRYAVFLTPYGDTRGLYVASRTPTGFVVRESQGGRSTLSFDYRIVAQQFGARTGRLPHARELETGLADNADPVGALRATKAAVYRVPAFSAKQAKAFAAPTRTPQIHGSTAPAVPESFKAAIRSLSGK